jgi:DNA-binding NarL/FixJ family response regulator
MTASHEYGMYKGSPLPYIGGMIRVAIVEDDRDVREALKDFCSRQRGMTCALAEDSAEKFFRSLKAGTIPDVVLMDIGLPGLSGISAIRMLKDEHPSVDVIMLTVYMDPHKIFDSLCAGASGYLLKTTPFAEIRDAIQMVHAGGAPMSPQIARKVIEHFQRKSAPTPGSDLTAREREIVLGLVEGLSYKMLASRMNVTIETIRTHVKNIYQKLQIHSKAEVISRSLRGEI